MLFFSLLMIAGIALCLLFLQPFPLLHDYPEWMYQGWLVSRLFTGDSAVLAAYTLVSFPVPNSLSQVAIALFSVALPPVIAGKVWLGIYLAAASLVGHTIWRRHRDSAQLLLLTTLVLFGPGFWNGYINFQFALLLFTVFLLSEKHGAHSPFRTVLFSLLIFFAHAAVFGVFGVYCLAQGLLFRAGSLKVRLTALLPLIPSLALLCWYTFALLSEYQGSNSTPMGLMKWVQYKIYTVAKQGPFHNFIVHTGESLLERVDWFYKIGFVVNFLFAVLLLAWLVWLVWAWLYSRTTTARDDESPSPAALVSCFAVCVFVFLLSGANTFGVVNLGERFLMIALMVVLLHFRCPRVLKNLMTYIAAVFMVYVLAANLFLSGQALREYAVARSSATSDLTDYVDDIYASSRHQYFNHRLFIYADRGLELSKEMPGILEIDIETSILRRIQ